MDNVHKLAEHFPGNTSTAYQLRKWMSMSINELTWLYDERNHPEDDKLFTDLRNQLHLLGENMFELYDFDFIANRLLFIRNCKKCQHMLHTIIGNQRTRESHERIDFICNFFCNTNFLKYAFDASSAFNRATITDIIQDLRSLRDNEVI